MKLAKKMITGSLISVCALTALSVAAAPHYTIGGSLNGSALSHSSMTYVINGASVLCEMDGGLIVNNGVARFDIVNFTGGAICPHTLACSLPWIWAAPTSDAGPDNVKIPFCVVIPTPFSRTCAGTLTGTLTNSGKLTFAGNFPNCKVSSTTPTSIVPILDAVFP